MSSDPEKLAKLYAEKARIEEELHVEKEKDACLICGGPGVLRGLSGFCRLFWMQ